MTTEKQKTANRRNAKHSTGPKTQKGKRASCMNALKHGLTGEQIVIPGEDPSAFNALKNGLIEEYSPQTTIEEELVVQCAATLWRLKRIPIFEKSIMEWSHIETKQADALIDFSYYQKNATKKMEAQMEEASDEANKDPLLVEAREKAGEAIDHYVSALQEGQQPFAKLGRMLVNEGKGLDALSKLSHYQSGLIRDLNRIMNELEALQQKRMKTITPAD
jgi:hypothetical protein